MHTQYQKALSILLLTSLLLQSCGTNLMLGEQRSEMRKQKEEATQQAPLPSAEPTPPLRASLHSQPKTVHASASPSLQPHTPTENPPPYTPKAAWKARQQRRGRPLPLDCRGLLGGGGSDDEGAGEEKQNETSLDECVEIEGKHVSTQYWYEDSEIGRILEAVLSSHSNDISADRKRYGLGDGRNIFVLGPLDNISPYGLSKALEEHGRQPGLVLIPFNLGRSHWVGLMLEYNPQGGLARAEYYDSLQERVPPYLDAMLQAHSYGRAGETTAFTCVSGQGLVIQANSSDCGPCTVENLLANAGLNYEPNGDSVRRRLRHLNVLEHNDYGGFYDQFYARQQRNQPSFSPQELDALLALSVHIMHFPTLTARIQGIDFEQDDASLVLAQLRIGLEAEQENTAQDLRLIKENLFYWQGSSPLESAPLKLDFNQLRHLKVLLSRGEKTIEAEREQLRGGLSASDIFSSGIFRAVGAAMVGGDFDPTIPPEEACPLIAQKLAQPERELPLEDSIELLTTCINYGQVRAQKMTGKEGIIVIGNTGAGKSTFVNYLAGCQMELKAPEELEGTGIDTDSLIDDVVVAVDDDDIIAPIGHTKKSKTFMPQIETTAEGNTYCDCPGFLDNRGVEINIANAVNIRTALAQAQGVKVVILVNYDSLKADRGRGLTDMLTICSNLFGHPENLLAHKDSILIGVTKVPPGLKLDRIKKWLTKDTPEIMQALADRLFLFDPLDRSTAEGWWNRAECLRQIAALTPITSPGRIFRTVLIDSDKMRLVEISEEIDRKVRVALKENNFSHAAEQLDFLNRLGIIGHPEVDWLLKKNVNRFRESFRQACLRHDFNKAEALIQALREAAGRLGMGGMNVEVLEQYLTLTREVKEKREESRKEEGNTQKAHERVQEAEKAFKELYSTVETRVTRGGIAALVAGGLATGGLASAYAGATALQALGISVVTALGGKIAADQLAVMIGIEAAEAADEALKSGETPEVAAKAASVAAGTAGATAAIADSTGVAVVGSLLGGGTLAAAAAAGATAAGATAAGAMIASEMIGARAAATAASTAGATAVSEMIGEGRAVRMWTDWFMRSAKEELDSLKKEAATARQKLKEAKAALEEAKRRLEEAERKLEEVVEGRSEQPQAGVEEQKKNGPLEQQGQANAEEKQERSAEPVAVEGQTFLTAREEQVEFYCYKPETDDWKARVNSSETPLYKVVPNQGTSVSQALTRLRETPDDARRNLIEVNEEQGIIFIRS